MLDLDDVGMLEEPEKLDLTEGSRGVDDVVYMDGLEEPRS